MGVAEVGEANVTTHYDPATRTFEVRVDYVEDALLCAAALPHGPSEGVKLASEIYRLCNLARHEHGDIECRRVVHGQW